MKKLIFILLTFFNSYYIYSQCTDCDENIGWKVSYDEGAYIDDSLETPHIRINNQTFEDTVNTLSKAIAADSNFFQQSTNQYGNDSLSAKTAVSLTIDTVYGDTGFINVDTAGFAFDASTLNGLDSSDYFARMGDTARQVVNDSMNVRWIENGNGLYYNIGNVSIGTTDNSTYKFRCQGNSFFSTTVSINNGISFSGSPVTIVNGTATGDINMYTRQSAGVYNSNQFYLDAGTGYIGTYVTSPLTYRHINISESTTTIGSGHGLAITNTNATVNNLSQLILGQSNSDLSLAARISGVHNNRTGGSEAIWLDFSPLKGGALTDGYKLFPDSQKWYIDGNKKMWLNDSGLHIYDTAYIGQNTLKLYSITDSGYYDAIGSHVWEINGTEKMRLNNSGNLGIGITNPNRKVHIYSGASGAISAGFSTTGLVIENNSNTDILLLSPNTTSANYLYYGDPDDQDVGGLGYSHTNDYLLFRAGGSSNSILSNTNMGLFTITPSQALDVNGDVRIQGDTTIFGSTDPDTSTHANNKVTHTDTLQAPAFEVGLSSIVLTDNSGVLEVDGDRVVEMPDTSSIIATHTYVDSFYHPADTGSILATQSYVGQNSDTSLFDYTTNKITSKNDTLIVPGNIYQQDTLYYSFNPSRWLPGEPDVDDVTIVFNQAVANANGIDFHMSLNLPNGYTIIDVIAYGSETDESYTLRRNNLANTSVVTIANANFNTLDNTLSSQIIDNDNYSYVISSSTLDATDVLYGVRVRLIYE